MNLRIRLRRAGMLVAAGLLLGLLSLLPLHPLAFIAFVGLSVPITAAGTIYFLLSLIGGSEPQGNDSGRRSVVTEGADRAPKLKSSY
jgi:hypothetical protein